MTLKVLKSGEPRDFAELVKHPPARLGVILHHDDNPLHLDEPSVVQQSSYMGPRLYSELPLSVR